MKNRRRMKKKGLMANVLMKKNLSVNEDDEEKWVKYYSSKHQILLVGEGDFSFSLCLGRGFGSASNIVASSLDSHDDVLKKYKAAKYNLDKLKELGACLLHGLDATKMELYPDLKMRRFDRIVFNFPHAGFHGKEVDDRMIMRHRGLVLNFFRNAKCLLQVDGEIHVSHKNKEPYSKWNIEELASQSLLTLIDCEVFKQTDYPGYNNKRGDGSKCDEDFYLGSCNTYKFVHNYRAVEILGRRNRMDSIQPRDPPFQATKFAEEQYLTLLDLQRPFQRPFQPWPPSINLQYPQTDLIGKMDAIHLSLGATNETYHVIGGSSSYLEGYWE